MPSFVDETGAIFTISTEHIGSMDPTKVSDLTKQDM